MAILISLTLIDEALKMVYEIRYYERL